MIDVRAARLATIARAVAHLRSTDRHVLLAQLAAADMRPHWKTNPDGLADYLADARADDEPARLFGLWKLAQRVLAAAGLPTS
ncbi:hypothetical protein JOL79_06770 [Microbispora sp. RL4-1S]|uniref:Uncharacterized protein n=1 Tax=Microbispora oryzae TaxID=2806554 RepID=A0A940WL57_9ACTN|nr:hypothetical protein [Microbispora oryzae]MBP2703500.1 hypothetical protein [Microbispora oryzae]